MIETNFTGETLMGCDIHCYAEKKGDGWYHLVMEDEPFGHRSYAVFAFLADVRNYSGVPCLAAPRGLPLDVSPTVLEEYRDWAGDAHTPSWLSIEELLNFDYEAIVEDRRVTRQVGPNSWDGGCTAEPGGGTLKTWREFLGDEFFADLATLRNMGAGRIVFWFDN